jgi:hypothetical protein
MKKKTTEKLTLKKETVRQLEESEAQKVVGEGRPSEIRCTETQTCPSLGC